DLQQLVDRQCRRTCLSAHSAINASACITRNARRTEQGDQSEEPSVRAKITAPKVLHENRGNNQPEYDPCCRAAKVTKEVEHAHVDDERIGAIEKFGDGRS